MSSKEFKRGQQNYHTTSKSEVPTLKYRKSRGDMLEVLKIVHGYNDNINMISRLSYVDFTTTGNTYKLYQSYVKYDLRRHFFTEWCQCGSVCLMVLFTIKNRINTLWTNQDVLHNWETDFTGTANQSLRSLQR